MRGKRVLVTGATTGIGRVTAVELGRMGAEVVIVARDKDKAEATLAELREAGAPPAHALMADLSLMSSVRTLAEEVRGKFDRIDVLVNNAGAIFGSRALTEEGFERTFALNHLSYFLLSNLLLDRIPRGGRIVNVSSDAHRPARVELRRPAARAALHGVRRLLPVEADEPALHLRAGAPRGAARHHRDGARIPGRWRATSGARTAASSAFCSRSPGRSCSRPRRARARRSGWPRRPTSRA